VLGAFQDYGNGLYYLDQVFKDGINLANIKRTYRETPTQWQMLTPNRLMAIPNNNDYDHYNIGKQLVEPICNVTGFDNLSLSNIDVFIDLPGHTLSWHFDHDHYRVLLQVYTGDVAIPDGGTCWYIGEENKKLFETYGTDKQVNKSGLSVTETQYKPGAGYINDNTQRKAHGTNCVRPGTLRESVLFTFN
jgi:hypothetical protein